jgi:hypothetical protein
MATLAMFMSQLFRNTGNLKLLEPKRPVQACNGKAFTLFSA